MMFKRDSIFFISFVIFIRNIVDSHSSKYQSKNKSIPSSFRSNNLQHILRKRHTLNFKEMDLKVIFKNPCILTKIVSILDIHKFRVIVSRRQIEFTKSLSKCNASIGILKSFVFVQGDENNYENLKQNLLHNLSRDIPCYIVLCTMVCSSLILSLAHILGFASGIYVWILIGQPAFQDEIHYPKKWVGINFKHNSLSDANSHTTNINNSNHHTVLNRILCYDIKLVTSQDEYLWFQYPKKNAFEKDVSSGSDDPEMVPCSNMHSPRLKMVNFFKKEIIRVTMIGNAFGYYRPDFLDRTHLVCHYGLLCWVIESSNQKGKRKPNCCQGLTIDILSQLKEDLNVDIYLYEAVDRIYGSNINGSWNGMIQEVVSGRADMAADYFSVTEARLSAVDYAGNFHVTDMVVASKMQLSNLHWLNLEVFSFISTKFWALIFSITFITSFIIYWSERFICNGYTHKSWIQSFLYTLGLLVQRDVGGTIPQYLGSRTVSIVLAITMLIIMTTYVAVLTTKNITTRKTLPISGLNDPKVISPTSNFKIATWNDSSYTQMFETSDKPIWRNLGQFMKPYNFNSLPEITRQLKNGSCHAIITNTLSLAMMWRSHDGCDIQFEEVISQDPLAFVLTKGSYWKNSISTLIQIYMESGKLVSLEHKWLASKCDSHIVDISQKFGMLYLSGACSMIVLGVLLSGVVFIFEHIYFAKRQKRSSYSVNHTL